MGSLPLQMPLTWDEGAVGDVLPQDVHHRNNGRVRREQTLEVEAGRLLVVER